MNVLMIVMKEKKNWEFEFSNGSEQYNNKETTHDR